MRTPIERAILALHPTAQPLIDYILRDDADGRGVYISAWKLPGDPPADRDIATLAAQYDAAEAARESEASALRTAIIQAAQGAVGQSVTALTAPQVRALLVILLWKEGALTPAGVVRPLAEWVRS